MQHVSYQTIRLGRGRHSSPSEGACVMELASMLAGEPFTDHPRTVSRTIGAFLRTYNDRLDDERRQDLYAFAAKAVGTAGPESVEVFRSGRLVAWADEVRRRRFHCRLIGRFRRGPIARRFMRPEDAAQYAARAIGKPSDDTHAAALALVDELIAMGSGPEAWRLSDAWPTEAQPSETELGGVL